jgi:signal transduction histidine kinase
MNATATKMGREAEGASVPRTRLSVLLVEDDVADRDLILRELTKGGFELTSAVVQTAEEFRQQVRANRPDVVVSDYNLGQWRGTETLGILRDEGLDVPLILVSGTLGDVAAVECIKLGVTDYVLKDRLARLPEAVRSALDEQKLRQERRQAQADLAGKVEELARSNRDLEQFAYVAAHDLQEPLRMVSAYTQLLDQRYRGKLDANADKYIVYAVEGALRMQTLIQDLLAFSRVGRNGHGRTNTDCADVVDEALQNLRAAVEESGAVITCRNIPSVNADRAQMVQLFQNLIGNAIKFKGQQAPVIQISAEGHEGISVFAVADNGIGIAAEHLEVIFVIFQRLHTRSEYSGNGMGLAICKKIVEQHGGRIWVDSKLEAGSTFRFTLPTTSDDEKRSDRERHT